MFWWFKNKLEVNGGGISVPLLVIFQQWKPFDASHLKLWYFLVIEEMDDNEYELWSIGHVEWMRVETLKWLEAHWCELVTY